MIKLRVFVSSVQKKLADERRAVKTLITSDPFLDEHCVPILYEDEPSMLKPAPQGYLDVLARCQVYLVIIGSEYGKRYKGLSAVHHEYHFAQKKELPVLVCIRAEGKTPRDSATEDFISEIRDAGHKYHRFGETKDLQRIVLECLTRHVKKTYHVAPSPKDAKASLLTVVSASRFDQQRTVIRADDKTPVLIEWKDVDLDIARELAIKSADDPAAALEDDAVKELLLRRGLLWIPPDSKKVFCSSAGLLLFAKNPTVAYPQSCIRLLSFKGKERDPKPADFLDINKPIPKALETALQFIDKNTRHPLRVAGIRRRRLDEYPIAALREALINAMAHRDYEDASRRIHVELFKDRIEVSSPGLLPGGITLAQFRSGKVHPCSRNPTLSQALRLLGLMEEMGTGVLRMKQAMLDHGLDKPQFDIVNGCFVVTFSGPGDNLDRLRMPETPDQGISPSVEDQLNERQKKILEHVAQEGTVTNRWCRNRFQVVYNTAYRDLKALVNLRLLKPVGRGRSVRYVPKDGEA